MNDPSERVLTWNYLLTETYRIYWERFWGVFRIALLPAVIGYILTHGRRLAIRAAIHLHWLKPFPSNASDWAILTVLALAESCFFWILSTFFFAALASDILNTSGDQPGPLADAYSTARKRLEAVIAIGLLTWAAFFLGRGIIGLPITVAFSRSSWFMNYWALTLVLGIPLLMLAGILARFGLAIPELMQDPAVSVRQALRNSFKKTEDWELFFMTFLAKSAAIGLLLYWLYGLAIGFLWQYGWLNDQASVWIDRTVYISLAAVLEPPLFIAFAILCRDWKPAPEEPYAPPPIG
ncbi:MAG TPA: hypothetical protein VNW97_07885 [Candidatus Saccharimonadales bacterium]|jgi:hypothetical protein|nr:hypothetical protein [Candidatus Saccharimonadales bacterium]